MGNRKHQINNFEFKMIIILPYCLKANRRQNREENFEIVMFDVVDEE